jgi:hypothetical protein
VLRLGTTAFSFTNEWLARRYTLEGLIARVAEDGLGPGLELIGFQAWRSYPRLAADEVLAFRRLCDDHGLEPAALGAYVDSARRADGPMTEAEAVDFLAPQIADAADLGFSVLRLHAGIAFPVLERLIPAAERAGLVLATELQGAQSPDDPAVAALLDFHDRIPSASLGLALDCSVAMTRPPRAFEETVCALGMARHDLDRLVAQWSDGVAIGALLASIAPIDAPSAALDEARAGLFRFGRQEPSAWRPLVSRIVYAHAKFWELDDAGDDPTVRTRELIDVLRDGGYEGVIASEWGGSAWVDADDVDAFELVRRHHERCRALVCRPALELPA